MAGPAPTAQSIKDQAFASDGYARAMGRLDPDPYRAPIDGDRWERIDTELRIVSAQKSTPRAIGSRAIRTSGRNTSS